jgi:hypothetical protein
MRSQPPRSQTKKIRASFANVPQEKCENEWLPRGA